MTGYLSHQTSVSRGKKMKGAVQSGVEIAPGADGAPDYFPSCVGRPRGTAVTGDCGGNYM